MTEPRQTDLEDFLDPQDAADFIGPRLPTDHASRVKGLRRRGAAVVLSAEEFDAAVADHGDHLPDRIAEALLGPRTTRR